MFLRFLRKYQKVAHMYLYWQGKPEYISVVSHKQFVKVVRIATRNIQKMILEAIEHEPNTVKYNIISLYTRSQCLSVGCLQIWQIVGMIR